MYSPLKSYLSTKILKVEIADLFLNNLIIV